MRRGDGHTGQGADEQPRRRRDVRGKALVFIQPHHVHAHRFDDLHAADGGAERHDERAENHEPGGNDPRAARGVALRQRQPQEEHAHEFLAVLRAVHERRARRRDHLTLIEKGVGFAVIRPAADFLDELCHRPAQKEADGEGKDQPEQHFRPFRAVHAVEIAVHGDGGTGQPRDEGVAFAGGNAERPGEHRPDDDGEHRRAEGDERFVRVGTEVHHVIDGLRDLRGDQRHDEHAEKVENRRHGDRHTGTHRAGRDAGRDGVGRVRPAVDEYDAERQDHRHPQRGRRRKLLNELR